MTVHRTFQPLFNVLFVSVLAAGALIAQTGNGVVQGTVLDASKAVIPGAKAILANTRTGVIQNTVSSTAGVYYFGAVPPGDYMLTIEAAGFRKFEGTLNVQVGQTVAVDPVLEVGSLGNTVEVTAVASTIATDGMQVSDVKDSLRIHQLPLNG